MYFLGFEGVVEVLDGDEGVRSRYYFLVESFLSGLEDLGPPSLDDNSLSDDVLGLINVLPRYVPSRNLLDLYSSLHPPRILLQFNASPALLGLNLTSLSLH